MVRLALALPALMRAKEQFIPYAIYDESLSDIEAVS